MKLTNLTVVWDADANVVARKLNTISHGYHFTNGVYSAPPSLIVPTTVAAAQYFTEQHATKSDTLVLAINSDKSVVGLMDKKNVTLEERARQEPQDYRAMKIAEPLCLQFPGRPIAIVFYDEETPEKLYGTLDDGSNRLKTLHKWGFGTAPNAPRIEGADHFEQVFGLPLPNDIKPVAYDITASGPNKNVMVVKLTETFGRHGAPYLSPDNKLLFPVASGLGVYAQSLTQLKPPGPHTPGF